MPPALPYSMSGYRDDGYAGSKEALSETSLDCKGVLGTKPCTSVFFGKEHAPNSNTGGRQRCHIGERNRNNPSAPKDLVRRSRSTAATVDMPHGERRSSRWVNLLQHGAVGPQTRLNYAASLLKFESWLEQRGENRDRRRNRCHNVHLDGKRVHERKSGERRRTVAQCLDGQVPIVRQAWCPQVAENQEKPPGLATPLTWTLEEPWVRAVWSGIGCRLVEQGQHSVGLLVMTGILTYARPGELLRMRQCDLVPPLRGALQNFSIILAAEETGRPTKVRTFNDTLELDGLLARKLVPFWMALRGQGSKNPLWPFTYPIFCRFSPESDNRFDVATNCTLPMETFWPVNRHSRRLPVVGASQKKTRTMASHENCPTVREALPLGTKVGNPCSEKVRQHLLRCDEQLVVVLRDDPHTAHLGPGGLC